MNTVHFHRCGLNTLKIEDTEGNGHHKDPVSRTTRASMLFWNSSYNQVKRTHFQIILVIPMISLETTRKPILLLCCFCWVYTTSYVFYRTSSCWLDLRRIGTLGHSAKHCLKLSMNKILMIHKIK